MRSRWLFPLACERCGAADNRTSQLVYACSARPTPAHLSEADRKKALNKLKKAEAKAKAAEPKKEAGPTKKAVGAKEEEPDLDGLKFLQVRRRAGRATGPRGREADVTRRSSTLHRRTAGLAAHMLS